MRKLIISGLITAGLAFGSVGSFAVGTVEKTDAQVNQKSGSMEQSSDRNFMMKAAQGGMLEVQLGNLAAQRASNNDVKEFAQRMVKDHTDVNNQLMQLASDKGVNIPDKLNAKHQETINRLSKLSGPAFDRAYMSEMVKDHVKDINEFKQHAGQTQDQDLKNWTEKTVSTFQDHLNQARKVASEVGANTAGNTGQKS